MEDNELKLRLAEYLDEHFNPKNSSESRSFGRSCMLGSLGSIGSIGTLHCTVPKIDFNAIFDKTKSETFSEMLSRLVEESGEKTSEIYTRANVDRQLFSKIKKNAYYKPAKDTVVAFALALKLDLDKAKNFFAAAGYTLTTASKRDVIISFFIENEIFDTGKLNDCLHEYDEPALFGR